MELDHIYNADCLEILKTFPADKVNLIVTSPPYADNRKAAYGGTKTENYVKWFLPISKELYRVLTTDGSFILNIKEHAKNGERSTYVLELILKMRKQGWIWTEEYIWCKKTSMPGKWPNRFRDAWERCLHFTKNKKFKMNQEAVMVPIGNWSKDRIKKLSKNDRMVRISKSGSGVSINMSNWARRDLVYPTNVLYLSPETTNRGHAAVFPILLPSWFIMLFTDRNDVVLDPFMGSGTTGAAAKNLDRHYVGMEINKKYHVQATDYVRLIR